LAQAPLTQVLNVCVIELQSSGNSGISDLGVLSIDHAPQQGAAPLPKHDFHLKVTDGEVLQTLPVELLAVAERDQAAVLKAVIDYGLADVFEVYRAAVLDDGRVRGRAARENQSADNHQRRDAAGNG